MGANEPRGMISKIYVELHKTLLNTIKCISFGSSVFREDVFHVLPMVTYGR